MILCHKNAKYFIGRHFHSEGGGGGGGTWKYSILTMKMLKINNVSSIGKEINNVTYFAIKIAEIKCSTLSRNNKKLKSALSQPLM